MRKIGFTIHLTTYLTSVIAGAAVFGTFIYFSSPEEVKSNPLPVVNFANAEIDSGSITGSSPFAVSKPEQMSVPDAPVPPGVPSMAGAGMTADVLTVIGVLPPDVVILQKGSETLTARVGTETKWGTVNSVTSSGASIDGAFLNIK